MMMAGSLHPPFSLFLPEEKEKTGRARSKREKEVSPLRGDVGRGTRKGCFLRVRMSSARGVVRARVCSSMNGQAALSAGATWSAQSRPKLIPIDRALQNDALSSISATSLSRANSASS